MSTGQAIGAVVGAAAGFVIGGPAGAVYGAQIGMMAGGYLDPPKGPTMEGPRLSDLSAQTSTYGAFIPRTYGTIAVAGNEFWRENNSLKETSHKQEAGGKGGSGSPAQETFTYSATLAIGICVGPKAGIRRVWAGPNLVYNAGAGDLASVLASNKASARFKFYLGTATQMPDSRIQADLGVANTSAYRGLCYVVIKDFQLEKYGNTVPTFRFEVVSEGDYGPTLTLEREATFSQPHNNSAFVPRAYYLSQEKAVFYVPQWNSDYPSNTSILKYEMSPGGLVRVSEIPLTGLIGYNVPPSGSTDIDDEYWLDSSSVFASGSFTGDSGYLEHRGSLYAGLTGLGSRTLHTRSAPAGVSGIDLTIPTTAACFAIGAGGVYTLSSGGVRLYDDTLTMVSDHLFALPAMYFPYARAECVDGVLYLYSGDGIGSTYRINDGLDGYSFIAAAGSPGPIGYYSLSVSLSAGVLVRAGATYDGKRLIVEWFNLREFSDSPAPLAAIVSAECALTGLLSPSDIDVTDLTDSVTGYRVSKIGGIRAAIEPLQGAFPFDVIQSGYKLKFISRGSAPVASVAIGDMGVDEQLRQSREMDSQMPNEIVISYLDKGRNYDANQQPWSRPSTGAVNKRSIELPIVLSASQAAQIIERLGNLYWLERTDIGPFSLPPTYSRLEPADSVTLDAGYAQHELRLTSVNYRSDGSLECSAKLGSAAVYVSTAVADSADAYVPVEFAGTSKWEVLDLPPVNTNLQNGPAMCGVMAGWSGSWSGGTIYRSGDSGQTWADLQGFTAPCTSGFARGILGAHPGNLIDRGSTLVIDAFAGIFESVTESQMLNGANMLAYGVNGRWEIIRFMTATLNGDGTYTLSGFMRGDIGTEWATGLHLAGDVVVLLNDPDLAVITMPTELIGAPRDYRGITNGADFDSDSSRTITYTAENLECLSPVHPAATRTAGDITLSWTRRSRIAGWRDYVDVELGEAVEAYEVDVMDGATVKRTITSGTQSATYSSAAQTADFGSPQAAVTFRIYQLSTVVGRGRVLEVTL